MEQQNSRKPKKRLCANAGCKGTAFAAVNLCMKCFAEADPARRGLPLPPNVDIRTFDDMPLNVRALRDSDTIALSSDEGFKAAVQLWCGAWHQIPAASLPDDDTVMARTAGYGRDLKGWKKVKAEALRGFVQCDDGRWYHLYMCDKAWVAWGKSEDGRAAANRRHGNDQPTDKQQDRPMRSQYSGTSPRIATPHAVGHAVAGAAAMRSDMGPQCSEQRREITTTSSVPTTAPARASAEGADLGQILTRTADEIWRLAGRSAEADRKRASGNVDDYRHVRGWIEQGFSETEITGAAKAVIEGAGEIRSLWGLLAKAMPEALAKVRTPTAALGADDVRPELRYRDYRKTGRWLESWGDPIRDTPEHVRAKVDAEGDKPPAEPKAAPAFDSDAERRDMPGSCAPRTPGESTQRAIGGIK